MTQDVRIINAIFQYVRENILRFRKVFKINFSFTYCLKLSIYCSLMNAQMNQRRNKHQKSVQRRSAVTPHAVAVIRP